MPDKKNDILVFGAQNPLLKVVHGSSTGKTEEILRASFQGAKAGDTIGGDFNVDFASKEGQDALVKVLDEMGLTFDISDETVAKLHLDAKYRLGLQLNPQFAKQYEPFATLKDGIYTLRTKQAGESTIPLNYAHRIDELYQIEEQIKKEIGQLRVLNGSTLYQVYANHKEVTNYSNLKESFGNDHSSVAQRIRVGNKMYITYMVNSTQYEAINLKKHYSDATLQSTTPEERTAQYNALSALVYREAYKLYCIRDNVSEKDRLTDQADIENYTRKKLLKSTEFGCLLDKNDPDEVHRFRYIEEFFHTIYNSPEFKTINGWLRKPLLDNSSPEAYQTAINANIAANREIVRDDAFQKKFDKVFNCIGQKLLIGQIPKNEQSLAEITSGFDPFTHDGMQYTSEEITNIQTWHIEDELEVLWDKSTKEPGITEISVTVGLIEGGSQERKISELKTFTEKMNMRLFTPVPAVVSQDKSADNKEDKRDPDAALNEEVSAAAVRPSNEEVSAVAVRPSQAGMFSHSPRMAQAAVDFVKKHPVATFGLLAGTAAAVATAIAYNNDSAPPKP